MVTDDSADAIIQLADVLLPGDELFPSADATGMAGLLLARMRTFGDGTLCDRLQAAIAAAGGPLGPLLPAARHAVVAQVEASEPKLFEDVRKIVYLTYYEQDSVVAAIPTLGMPYNRAPLPDGYAREEFDAAVDAPRHGRGRWTATEHVVRLDLTAPGHPRSEA